MEENLAALDDVFRPVDVPVGEFRHVDHAVLVGEDLAWKLDRRGNPSRTGGDELDSAIIQHPKVWESSGHLKGFSDPLVDCKKCKGRYRAEFEAAIERLASNSHSD